EMARRRSIPLGSLLYLRGLRQFEANLRAMLCRYRDAGVPVFIGTVAANDRDLPPFVSGLAEQTDSAAWNAAFRAVTVSPPADSGRALAVLDSLIAVDDLSADAYFARARLHEAAGRLEQARADYRAARDRDELRFRAPEAINQTIREVAGECGAVIVETRDALAEASPVGVVGDAVMLEHVHPNLDGYFLLSDTYYEALQQAGFFDSTRAIPAQIARQDMLVTALDSALADLHVRRLRNNWPFQPPGVTRPDTITVSNPVDVLALDVLRGRRAWLDATAALGAQYEAIGDLDAALRVARALLIEQSYDPQPYILAGNILLRQGRFAPAFSFFQAADAQGASAEARALAGHALIRGGRPVDAIPWIHRALEIEPDHGSALYDLAVANAELGRADEARRAADRLRQVDPDGPATRRLLTRLNLTSSLPELAFDSAGAGRSEP